MERKIEYGQERLPFASERISTLPWWMKSRATPTRAMYVPSPQTYKTFSDDSSHEYHTTTCCASMLAPAHSISQNCRSSTIVGT